MANNDSFWRQVTVNATGSLVAAMVISEVIALAGGNRYDDGTRQLLLAAAPILLLLVLLVLVIPFYAGKGLYNWFDQHVDLDYLPWWALAWTLRLAFWAGLVYMFWSLWLKWADGIANWADTWIVAHP